MTLPSEPSIAVLPFANASADRTQDYLATGLAEEISIALSRTPRLFIAAPRSAMGFGPNTDAVSAAARALGVGNVTIMFRHVLPNAMVATLTFLPLILTGSITSLTALDFLGLGLPPGSPSLG